MLAEFGLSILQNLIYDILKVGYKSTFKDDKSLENEFIKVTKDTFDLISNEYPVQKFIGGQTFWDYISSEIISITEEDNFYEQYKSFEVFLTNLLLEECRKFTIEDINKICTKFYEIFNQQIISTKYLYKYMQDQYLQNILTRIDKLTDLFNGTINNSQKIDYNSLSNYILEVCEYTSKKIRGLCFETKFVYCNNVNIDFDEIIKDSRGYLILGDAGSGKTFALDRIINIISNNVIKYSNGKIPIALQLSGYGINYDDIIDGSLKKLKAYAPTIVELDLRQALCGGIVVLVLDGLDEVKNKYYHKCINDIKNILVNKNMKIIISSRKNTYSNELSELIDEIFIKDINELDINNILDKVIENKHRLDKDMIKTMNTPLLLNIAIEVINENGGNMPKSKVDLYNKFVNTLISKWSKKKGMKVLPISKIELTKILCNIAFEYFACNYIPQDKLYEYVFEFFQRNVEEVFQYIISLGIFDVVNDESIIFKHKTFKEYFAAKYLIHKFCSENNYDIVTRFLSNKDWYQVYVFMSGLFDDWKKQNEFLELVLENNLRLYISCINEKKDFDYLFKGISDYEYSKLYLSILVNTYEKIVNKYFNQIKLLFDPYSKKNKYKNNKQICIIGNIGDKRYLFYSYFIENMDYNKITIESNEAINSHMELYKNNLINTTERYVDLKLSNKNIDSARQKAIDDIKWNLKSIIEKRKLIENKYILCEKINNYVKKLPIKNYTEIECIRKWVEYKLKKATSYSTKEGIWGGYSYNGIKLEEMYVILNKLEKYNILLKECTLPTGDLEPKANSYCIWEVYSKERLLERVKIFFMFYKSSFIELVENNFYPLRMYLPDYIHLPYKYFVEVIFDRNYKYGKYILEPTTFKYYYLADYMNSFEPEVNEATEQSDNISTFDKIKKSYLGKERYTNYISVSSTLISKILEDKCVSKFVYDLIKKNLECIFGKF